MTWNSIQPIAIALAAIINVTAMGGLLYLLIDRFVCLRAAYRLLRCLRKVAPETCRHLLWAPPFQWMFDPQRLEDFLLSAELEQHDSIRRHKEECRCWIAQYKSLPAYLLRIGSVALASGAFLIIIIMLILFA